METRDVGRKVGSGRQRRGNLYITRACADVWKGTRQLVYELIILSFSLSLSPALCGLSPSHSVSPSVPFGFVLVSVPFGLCLRYIRFSLRVPFHSDLVYAAAY